MSEPVNPALESMAALIQPELVLAQVWIRRLDGRFELRHVEDRALDEGLLRDVRAADLRELAQTNANNQFRPLKVAPDLRRGWRTVAPDKGALATALEGLYPGAVADCYAASQPQPPVTSYRDYTERQTGMYRITAMLDDAQAEVMARACCHASGCLKRRLWSVGRLPVDKPDEKSLIPCLEPCAVLMEFARTVMRLEQEQAVVFPTAKNEVEALRSKLEQDLKSAMQDGSQRTADFSNPTNPRRLRWMLEKLKPLSP